MTGSARSSSPAARRASRGLCPPRRRSSRGHALPAAPPVEALLRAAGEELPRERDLEEAQRERQWEKKGKRGEEITRELATLDLASKWIERSQMIGKMHLLLV